MSLWIEKGFNLNGNYSFQKSRKKYFPPFIDANGKEHEGREVTFATNIDFNLENKTYTVTGGVIQEGVFIKTKLDDVTIGIETLRLICKTVKELGWT